MIISIRGTSGSGKSTLVRRVMDEYVFKFPMAVEGRKQPLYYIMGHESPDHRDLVVIGHYESPCGGCDTIESFDTVFELVSRFNDEGYDVLFEGVLLYCEIPRTVELVHNLNPFHVIALNTPLEECVHSINLRRAERGDWEPVNPLNTITKFNGTITSMEKLVGAGVPVSWESRESAFELIRQLLELGEHNPHPPYILS